jgi:hypothetical protein
LAVVMDKSRARQVAQVNLLAAWLERERMSLWLSRKYSYLEPTDVVSVRGRTLRLTSEDFGATGIIKFDGTPSSAKIWASGPTGVSRLGFAPTLPAIQQDTDLVLLDIPLYNESAHAVGYDVAVAGHESPRWRGSAVYRSVDGGTNYTPLTQHTAAKTFGSAVTALGDFGGGNVFDEINSVDVDLTAGSGALSSATATQVLNGANLAVLGHELIQFKTATVVSGTTYRLSGLLRGRFGTEWAMTEHAVAERFCMLPVYDYAGNASDLTVERQYKAVSIGDALADAAAVPFTWTGARMRPLSPVHLGGGVVGSDVTLNWVRRTRTGGQWRDGGDVPLGESSEQYVVEIWNSTYTLCSRVTTVTEPTFTYTSAMQVADFGAAQQTIYFQVGQLGSYAIGFQARGTAPGGGGSVSAPLAPVEPYPVPIPTASGSLTADQRHMQNFATLFATPGRDHYLAYHYGFLQETDFWYVRFHGQIIADSRFFNGDNVAWANWVQEADLNYQPTGAELLDLIALADSV